MKRLTILAALAAILVMAPLGADAMDLTTNAIAGGKIAKVHACANHGGSGTSPDLAVSGLPAGTKYLAVIVDDPDAMAPAGKVWVHWNVVNIPAANTKIAAGTTPPGDELSGSSGGGYFGMCPPDGTHTYRFAVFALKDKIETGGFFGPSELTIEDFEKAYAKLILGKAVVSGTFG